MAGAPSYSAAAAGALTSMRGDLEDVQRLDVQVRDRERQLEAQHAQTQALLHRIHEARAQAEGCRNTIARLVKEEAAVKEVAEATAASGGGEAWSDDNYSAALAHARSACQRAIDGLRERSRFATMLEALQLASRHHHAHVHRVATERVQRARGAAQAAARATANARSAAQENIRLNQALAELDQHLASSRLNAAVADERRRQWEQAIEAAEASMRASTSRTRARLLQWAVALWRVDAARRERGEEEDAAAREAADDDQAAVALAGELETLDVTAGERATELEERLQLAAASGEARRRLEGVCMEVEDRRGRLLVAERRVGELEAQGAREVEAHTTAAAALREEAARVEEEARARGEQADQWAAASADAARLRAEAAALEAQAERSEDEAARLKAAAAEAEREGAAKAREAALLEERCRALDARNAQQTADAAAAQQKLAMDREALQQLRTRVAAGHRQDDARAEAVTQALRMAAV